MVIPAPSQNKTFSEKACEVIDEHIEGKTAILIGPGIWDEEGSQKVLIHTINRAKEKKIPIVLDADAINILSHLDLGILDGVLGVITPHPGEAGRLLKKTTSEIQKDRIQSAKEISQRTKLVSVLKGFRTIITDGENFFINTTGGAELATGGTGDVLAGIIGGLLAQGYSLMESAVAGVFIHGLAGEIVSKEKKFKLSLAEEVAENLERALAEILST
jgi:NAD(P)H-hydrate epimerase